jgi:hypothetical protein
MANLLALRECAPIVAAGDADINQLRRAFGLTDREMVMFQQMVLTAKKQHDNLKTGISHDLFVTQNEPALHHPDPTRWPRLKP